MKIHAQEKFPLLLAKESGETFGNVIFEAILLNIEGILPPAVHNDTHMESL